MPFDSFLNTATRYRLTNKKSFDNIVAMLNAKVIDGGTARSMLRELGYKIPSENEVVDKLLFEVESTAKISS